MFILNGNSFEFISGQELSKLLHPLFVLCNGVYHGVWSQWSLTRRSNHHPLQMKCSSCPENLEWRIVAGFSESPHAVYKPFAWPANGTDITALFLWSDAVKTARFLSLPLDDFYGNQPAPDNLSGDCNVSLFFPCFVRIIWSFVVLLYFALIECKCLSIIYRWFYSTGISFSKAQILKTCIFPYMDYCIYISFYIFNVCNITSLSNFEKFVSYFILFHLN